MEDHKVHSYRLEILTIAVAIAILFYQLLIPPIVGLADNGDFWRVMKWDGIQYQTGTDEDHLFYYINRTFSINPETRWRFYLSSEILFAKVGLLFNKIASRSGVFDLRVLGFVHTLFFLSAILFILTVTKRMGAPFRYILAALLLMVFCDVAYIAYFNSFYAEPASLIFSLFMVGFALKVASEQEPDIKYLLGFFTAAIFFTGAKHQNSILGLLLALFMFRLCFVWPQQLWKRVSILLSVLLCILSFGFLKSTPSFIKEAVLYNDVFYEILRRSSSPREDLIEMGLAPELVKLAGTHAFMPNVPIRDEAFRGKFFPHIGYLKILKFYLNHPNRLLRLLKTGAEKAFSMRFPGYLGNFEKSAGFPPAAQSQAFAIWSDFKERFFPKSIWILGTFFLFYTFAVFLVRVRAHTMMFKLISEFHLLLVMMAVAQFFVSVIGAGEQDLVKHLFLFNAIADLLVISLFLSGAWGLTRIVRRVKLHYRSC